MEIKKKLTKSDMHYSDADPTGDCIYVVISERAKLTILNEVLSHGDKETGGILLGNFINRVWYINEVIDGGLDENTIHRTGFFRYDNEYINHRLSKVNNIYADPLTIVGVWHRHPGSMDTFSSQDLESMAGLVNDARVGMLSMLVNVDPDFRMTFYYCNKKGEVAVVPHDFGDEYFMPRLTKYVQSDDLIKLYNKKYKVKNKTPLIKPEELAGSIAYENAAAQKAAAPANVPEAAPVSEPEPAAGTESNEISLPGVGNLSLNGLFDAVKRIVRNGTEVQSFILETAAEIINDRKNSTLDEQTENELAELTSQQEEAETETATETEAAAEAETETATETEAAAEAEAETTAEEEQKAWCAQPSDASLKSSRVAVTDYVYNSILAEVTVGSDCSKSGVLVGNRTKDGAVRIVDVIFADNGVLPEIGDEQEAAVLMHKIERLSNFHAQPLSIQGLWFCRDEEGTAEADFDTSLKYLSDEDDSCESIIHLSTCRNDEANAISTDVFCLLKDYKFVNVPAKLEKISRVRKGICRKNKVVKAGNKEYNVSLGKALRK